MDLPRNPTMTSISQDFPGENPQRLGHDLATEAHEETRLENARRSWVVHRWLYGCRRVTNKLGVTAEYIE